MTTLRELQRTFADAVRAAGSCEALAEQVVDPERARDRVGVYRAGYLSRLVDVMHEDYPKTALALGGRFVPVVREYIHKHPSDHPSLRHFGRHFPEFLGSANLRDVLPWLADLARLEWARVEAFDAPDCPAMRFEELRATPADRWPALRLKPVPSFRGLRLAWNLCDVWLALDEGRTPADSEPELTAVAVWRTGFVVRHRRCPAAEARAIGLFDELAPFSAICEAFGDSTGADLEGAARQAFAAIRQWVADGWIASPPDDGRGLERRSVAASRPG